MPVWKFGSQVVEAEGRCSSVSRNQALPGKVACVIGRCQSESLILAIGKRIVHTAGSLISRSFSEAEGTVTSAAGIIWAVGRCISTSLSAAVPFSRSISTTGTSVPLSGTIPLRTTAAWRKYTDIRTIPQGYGVITVTPIQYDETGRIFVLLDHPILNVLSVKVGDENYGAWKWRNGLDSTGRAVSFIQLADVLEGDLSVKVQAKINRFGELMTNPAEIIYDILGAIQGVKTDYATFYSFGAACRNAGIEVHGILDDATRTTRSYLADIAINAGAIWSGEMQGFMKLFPDNNSDSPVHEQLDRLTAYDVSVQADLTDIYTMLRISYDYDHSTGEPGQVLLMSAPEAVKQYGEITKDLSLRWVSSQRQAYERGVRFLRLRARPKWRIVFSSDEASGIPSGGNVALDHPAIPEQIRGNITVLGVERDGLSGKFRAVAPVGPVPRVEIVQQSGIAA